MLLWAIDILLVIGFGAAVFAAFVWRGRALKNAAAQTEFLDLKTTHALLMEASPFPIFAVDADRDFCYVFCNKPFADLAGMAVSDIVGKKIDSLFPDGAHDFRQAAEAWMLDGKLHEDILPFSARGGQRRIGRFFHRGTTLPGGSRRLFVELEDITDTREMSGILKNAARQDAFFNMVMSLIPCQVFIKDAQDKFQYCIANKNFTDYYSLAREEAVGHTDYEIFPEEVANQLRTNDKQVCAEPGKLFHFNEDISFRRKRNEVFQSLKVAFRTENGHLYLLGVCVDVTDSAKYTERLQNTQALLNLILNTLPVNIFAKNADDGFRYAIANRTFAEFVGFPASDIIGKTDAELFRRPEDAAWFREQDERTMKSEGRIDMVEHPFDAQGREHHLQTSKMITASPDGSRLLLGISVDVTELHDRITMAHINNEILEKTVAEPDLPKVLANISHILIEKLQCTHVLFARYDEALDRLKLFHEECQPGIQSVTETGLENHEALWQAHMLRLRGGEMIVYDDFRKIPAIQLLLKNNPDYPTRSLSAAPVFSDNRLFGCLMVSYIVPHIFSESDRNLLSSMANVIALAAIHDRQEKIVQRINGEKQAILDNISIPLWLYDREGRILQTNKAADLRLGDAAEAMRTPFACKDQLNCCKSDSDCSVRKVLRSGKSASLHYRCDRNEYEVQTGPVLDDSGKPIGAVSSFYDITDLNLMISSRSAVKDCLAKLLREQEMSKAIRMILKKMCESLDADCCYLASFDWTENTTSCVMEYAPVKEFLLSRFQHIPFSDRFDWRHCFDAHAYLKFFNLSAETPGDGLNAYPADLWRTRIQSVYTHRIIMGGKLWGCLTLAFESPVRELNSTELEFLGSASYCAELMLMHRDHQEKIISAMEQAKAADRAKSMFLSSMSHEIRTPLNAVIGFAELLKDNQLPAAERDEYLDGIRISGNALLSLINDVLDLSKLEADRMVFSPVETDLRQLLVETRRIFQQKCGSKGVALNIDAAEDFPLVRVDCLRIRQLLFNLVGNAVKFTDSGSIVMRAGFTPETDATGTLTIDVIDTGIGISEADQRTLFKPFTQAGGIRGTTTANSGTGLGLALCQRMMEKMNGELELYSEVGKGSDFRATIRHVGFRPFTPAAPMETEAETPVGTLHPSARLTALFVDDVPLNVKVGVALLAKLGIQAAAAENAAAAWSELEKKPFDILFTDLWMPGMNGCELAGKIRRSNRWPKMKLVALTADLDSGENFDMSVFDAILTKPVSFDQLARLVNDRLQPRTPKVTS